MRRRRFVFNGRAWPITNLDAEPGRRSLRLERIANRVITSARLSAGYTSGDRVKTQIPRRSIYGTWAERRTLARRVLRAEKSPPISTPAPITVSHGKVLADSGKLPSPAQLPLPGSPP